jgi:hypothetical protein
MTNQFDRLAFYPIELRGHEKAGFVTCPSATCPALLGLYGYVLSHTSLSGLILLSQNPKSSDILEA